MADTLLDAVELFLRHLFRPPAGERKAQRHGQLEGEALERLEQLAFLLGRVQELEPRWSEPIKEGYVDFATDPFFLAKLYTESFYFIAFRLLELINSHLRPVPVLHNLKAPGILHVRNRLLQHPEKAGGQGFTRSWMFTASTGPVMKAGRSESDPSDFHDAGLYANAAELARAICTRLRANLSDPAT